MATTQRPNFIFGNRKTLQGAKSTRIAMLEGPVASAQVTLFAQNVLPQTPQNITAVLGINSLTLGDKFTAHNPMNIKEITSMLGCTPELTLSALGDCRLSAFNTAIWFLAHSWRHNLHHTTL